MNGPPPTVGVDDQERPAPGMLAERGWGRRRLAVLVPVVAVVCGLVAGGLAGERVVGRRQAATVTGARGAGNGNGAQAGPPGVVGPAEQLRGAGRVLFTDPQGRVHSQGADGSGHRVLGQRGELVTRRAPSGFDLEVAAQLLSEPPDGRSAELGPDAEYAVVGPTGSLHLPAHALDVLPPGARVVVEVEGDQVVLKPTDGGGSP